MSSHAFFGFWLLFFGSILIVFTMKYVSAAMQARAKIANDDAYRKLAADAVTVQSGTAASLSAIQSELAAMQTRLAAVETILKAVG